MRITAAPIHHLFARPLLVRLQLIGSDKRGERPLHANSIFTYLVQCAAYANVSGDVNRNASGTKLSHAGPRW